MDTTLTEIELQDLLLDEYEKLLEQYRDLSLRLLVGDALEPNDWADEVKALANQFKPTPKEGAYKTTRTFQIDGKPVSVATVAEALDIARSQAYQRCIKRQKDGPLTWTRLKEDRRASPDTTKKARNDEIIRRCLANESQAKIGREMKVSRQMINLVWKRYERLTEAAKLDTVIA